jgi:uncharacterized protein DUF4154
LACRFQPINDAEAFTKRGGIIQIFVESGRIKFRINTKSAKRARLQLSSQLLALAEAVDEDAATVPDAPKTGIRFVAHYFFSAALAALRMFGSP